MKKKIITIIVVLAVILSAALLVNELIPRPFKESIDASSFDEESEYLSDFTTVHGSDYGVYACVTKNTSAEYGDILSTFVVEKEGLFGKKEKASNINEFSLNYLFKPKYESISTIPDYEIKNGDDIYGFVYCGVAPLDCKEITINGAKAELHKMSVVLNSIQADFNFYYCVVEAEYYDDEQAEVICTDNNGEKHTIFNKIY